MKCALITGITGQDGSYLAEFLLNKDYIVHGIVRISSNTNTHNIKNNYLTMEKLEVYNLAAQSHVKISFEIPEYTTDINAFGTLKLLEAIRSNNLEKITRFYQASTSEMFGKVQEIPQKETTPFYPRSPYGIAKLYSFWIAKNYREAYDMFISNGILFNHESPRRSQNFVTRKITIGLGKICNGMEDKLIMGNLDSYRDWGHARDYIDGIWRILQIEKPDDFVIATGEMHSVKEFIEKSFILKGFDIKWKGFGINEIGYDDKPGRELIFVDPKYFRPSEVDQLCGDATKAKKILGWEPKISFDELIKEMVEHDCQQ